jgi:trans-aconitate methyltransferase
MRPEVALQLIEPGVERTNTKQIWADLGAGNGLFTHALSRLIRAGSMIYAVDMNVARMSSISLWEQVTLKIIQSDFIRGEWSTEPLNGILMANALHFVKEKESFLKKLKERLTPGGRLLIVEYEMDKGNTWVPYPISFQKLSNLASGCDFLSVKKLKEVPSVYEGRMIYSVMME